MTDIQKTEQGLSSMIERLVDNLQKNNSANTEMLSTINIALNNLVARLSEIGNVSGKVSDNADKLNEIIRDIEIILPSIEEKISSVCFDMEKVQTIEKMIDKIASKVDSIDNIHDHTDEMNKEIRIISNSMKIAMAVCGVALTLFIFAFFFVQKNMENNIISGVVREYHLIANNHVDELKQFIINNRRETEK